MRWFIGGIICLIFVSLGCYFFYEWQVNPYIKEASETEKLLQKHIDSQKRTVDKKMEQTTKPYLERKIDSDAETTNDITESLITETEVELPQSPYGFGRYPEVPKSMRDSGYNPIWENPNWQTYTRAMEGELLSRVRIKAWEEGTESIGASIDYKTGLVLLNLPNTIYVWYGESIDPKTGETHSYFTQVAGMSLSIDEMMNGIVPDGVTVLDGETSGIDPYEYLDLSR